MSVRIIPFLAIPCLVLVACLILTGGVARSHVIVFRGHTGLVSSAVSSSEGRTVASASTDDGTIRLWDVAARRVLATLPIRSADVECFVFSRDGSSLAYAGSTDDTIRLWDVSTG